MNLNFENSRYYPVDMRLGIIYNDPCEHEAECGLGSERYHGLGTIGVMGVHLSSSEMYQSFRVESARTEMSPAYIKWEKSGFHTFINPDDGLDTRPVRPSGLDILRNCHHTTDGSICVDCLRKAAEAEKLLIRDRIENSKSLQTHQQTEDHQSGNPNADEHLESTEVFSVTEGIEDETVLSDPIEAALLRLEFGTRPDVRRQDVTLVRTALDKTFSLQQQLSDAQRTTRRALLAEIQRATEHVDQLIDKLAGITAERDTAQQEVLQLRRQLSVLLVQQEKLTEISNELLEHLDIDKQKQSKNANTEPSNTILKLRELIRSLPNSQKHSKS